MPCGCQHDSTSSSYSENSIMAQRVVVKSVLAGGICIAGLAFNGYSMADNLNIFGTPVNLFLVSGGAVFVGSFFNEAAATLLLPYIPKDSVQTFISVDKLASILGSGLITTGIFAAAGVLDFDLGSISQAFLIGSLSSAVADEAYSIFSPSTSIQSLTM